MIIFSIHYDQHQHSTLRIKVISWLKSWGLNISWSVITPWKQILRVNPSRTKIVITAPCRRTRWSRCSEDSSFNLAAALSDRYLLCSVRGRICNQKFKLCPTTIWEERDLTGRWLIRTGKEATESRLVYLLTPVIPPNLNIAFLAPTRIFKSGFHLFPALFSPARGPIGDCKHTLTLWYPPVLMTDAKNLNEGTEVNKVEPLITAPPPPGLRLRQQTPSPGLTNKKKNRQIWWPTVKVFHNRDFGKIDVMFNSPGLQLWLRQCT